MIASKTITGIQTLDCSTVNNYTAFEAGLYDEAMIELVKVDGSSDPTSGSLQVVYGMSSKGPWYATDLATLGGSVNMATPKFDLFAPWFAVRVATATSGVLLDVRVYLRRTS